MKRFAFFKDSAAFRKLLEAGLIAAALIIPFGFQIGHLGLYGDDWSLVLTPEISGNVSIFERLIQTILISLGGIQPAFYHLVNLLVLFIIGLSLHNVLIQIGIDRLSAISGVLLFELYPGFLQLIGGLHLVGNLFGLLFMVLSIHFYINWKRSLDAGLKFIVLGIIFSILSFLISPFSAAFTSFTFIFLFLWNGNNQKRIDSYILGILLLFSGVLFVFRFSHENVFLNSSVLIRTLKIWLDSFIVGWRQVLAVPANGSETLIYLLILVFTAAILFLSFRKIEKVENKIEEKNFSQTGVIDITIVTSCVIAGFGYIFLLVASGVNLEIRYPNDIALVSISTLASIFIVLGIKFIFLQKYQLAILVILIVLAGGAKYSSIKRFADENSRVEDMLAQLAVRGDYFQSGTVLISEQLPFDYTSQKSIDALLKYQFNNDKENRGLTFLSADIPELREFLHSPSTNIAELRIDNSTVVIDKKVLVGFWVKQGGCVQILNEQSELSDLPQELKYVASMSKPELFEISNLSDVKQLDRFRNKIENGWCFYYQLASRQAAEGNWQGVIITYTIAEEQGFIPQSLSDYGPILQAYLNEKLFSRSMEISKEFISQPEQKGIICNYWKVYQRTMNLTEEVIGEVEKNQSVLGCP